MNGTATSVLYRNLGSEAWPRQYHHQDLYTLERQLIYEYAKTCIYEKQKQLGMLSPFAEPYYHITETLVHEKAPTEKTETSEEKIEEEKPIIKDNNQDTEKNQGKKKSTSEEQCAKIENIIPMNTE